MMDQNKNNNRFLKCLLASMVIVTFVCLIHVSGALAQWPPYSNVGWSSQAFFGSPFFSFNPIFSYTGSFDSGFSTPYGNYPSPTAYLSSGLLSRGSYGNYSYNDIFSPYSNFMSSGSFVSPAFSEFNSPGVIFFPPPTFSLFPEFNSPGANFFSPSTFPLYPEAVYVGPNGGELYTGSAGNNPFYPGISSAFISNTPSPYTMSLAWYSPWLVTPSFFPSFLPSSIIRFPGGESSYESPPAYAPDKVTGEWKSQQLTDEDGNKIKGKLEYDRKNNLLKMLDSSLPLGEGELTEFKYTPTFHEAPISFKGVFDSGYTAYFSGTADNQLCPRDAWCALAGYFDVEGTYTIKNNEGEIVDRGTFHF